MTTKEESLIYGDAVCNSEGDIVSLHGCKLKVEHLPDEEGSRSDYWQAWVNGVQDDGLTRNEAIKNAYKRSTQI